LLSCRCQLETEIYDFLLAWLRDSELDKAPAIDVFCQAVLGDAVHLDVCKQIVAAVSLANDVPTQLTIVHLLNVLVLKHSEVVDGVYGFMSSLIDRWKHAVAVKASCRDLIGNLGALFIILVIYVPDFPDNLLIEVFQGFPQ
jgi:hypothetical protein